MLDFLMRNEVLTIIQVILCFGLVSVAYRLFGKIGMFAMAAATTLFANLEVATCCDWFGLVVSLGNVSFVANSLIQDTLNECEGGENTAKWVVWLGFAGCLFALLMSRISALFTPISDSVAVHEAFKIVFGEFSVVTLISLVTFLLSNRMNVKLYAIFSRYTEKPWIRSQASTWISQLFDTTFMTVMCAVFGVFAWGDVIALIVTTYLVKIICMVFEIPFLYWNKSMKDKGKVREIAEA